MPVIDFDMTLVGLMNGTERWTGKYMNQVICTRHRRDGKVSRPYMINKNIKLETRESPTQIDERMRTGQAAVFICKDCRYGADAMNNTQYAHIWPSKGDLLCTIRYSGPSSWKGENTYISKTYDITYDFKVGKRSLPCNCPPYPRKDKKWRGEEMS